MHIKKRHYTQRQNCLITSKAQLISLQKKYKTDAGIGKVLGCSRQNIEQIRKRHGVKPLQKPPKKAHLIIEILKNNPYKFSSIELSKKTGCTLSYVRSIASKYKLPIIKSEPYRPQSRIKMYLNKKKLQELQDKYGIDRNIAKFLKITTPYVCFLRKKFGVKKLK